MASLAYRLLRDQKGESQNASSGNHSNRISNLSMAVAFSTESRSEFVELIPATAADHFVVAHALVQWCSRFGIL